MMNKACVCVDWSVCRRRCNKRDEALKLIAEIGEKTGQQWLLYPDEIVDRIEMKLKVNGAAEAFFESFDKVIAWCQAENRRLGSAKD